MRGMRLPPKQQALALPPGGAATATEALTRPAPARLPGLAPAARRLLKHPRLMPYHRLMVAVVLVNLGVLWHHLRRGDWRIDDGSALSALSALTLVNFTAAVLIRQQNVLNVLYGLAGRGSRSWPLWIRWSVSKVHHVGGIHAGGALAGTAWLCAFTGVAILARAHHPASVTATTLVLCLRPRRPGAARRRLRSPAGAEPRAQRVRAVAPLRRLDGDRAVLGADAPPRRPQRGDATALERSRRLARLGAGDPDGERRLAVAAAAARAGHGRAPVLARRHRPLRLRRDAGVRVGGRDQPQPAARMARVRDGDHARAIRVPPAHLARRRLDRALHRRSAVARLGARRAGLGADGQGRAALRAGRLRRHRQRHRTVPRADPRRPRPRAARVVHARPAAPPTATPSSTRSRRRSPMPSSGTRRERGKPDLAAARPRGVPGLRRRSRLRREQQAHDPAPRPRPRAARHPGLRADLGLLQRTPASTLSGMQRCRPWTWDESGSGGAGRTAPTPSPRSRRWASRRCGSAAARRWSRCGRSWSGRAR